MKKKVLLIIIALALTIGVISFRPSFAWLPFIDGNVNKSQNVDIGEFQYTFEGGIHAAYINELSTQYVAPGENLVYVNGVSGTLKAYNASTITTNLRIRIDYSYWNGSTLETVAYGEKPAATDDFDVTFNNSAEASWYYNTTTKWWDYKATGALQTDPPYSIPAYTVPTTAVTTTGETTTGATTAAETTTAAPPAGDLITLITHLGYSGDLTGGNSYEDKNVKIKLTVEAKQADYVTWEIIYQDYYG